MKRRFFLFAAPAIVAAPSLMRVSTAAQVVPWNMDAEWISGRLVSGKEIRERLMGEVRRQFGEDNPDSVWRFANLDATPERPQQIIVSRSFYDAWKSNT